MEPPMDSTTIATWPDFHQNQTLNTFPSPYPPPLPPPSTSYTTHYPSYSYSYPQNPNISSSSLPQPHADTVPEPGIHPPGVDYYAPLNSDPVSQSQFQPNSEPIPNPDPNFAYAGQGHVVDSSSLVASYGGYYYDPNAQDWAAREAVRQYGVDPSTYGAGIPIPSNGTEYAIANPSSTWWTNTTTQPHTNGKWKKHPNKAKIKIVQSAHCEVCKVDCTSKDVLDQHKLGKKHKKNVEKLRESLKPAQVHPSGSSNPVIGPQEQNKKGKSTSGIKGKRKIETPEDLETKKKKVLEGGAAANAVRTCGICNVVCNSETVYNYHLAGKTHAAMVKKASHLRQSNAS